MRKYPWKAQLLIAVVSMAGIGLLVLSGPRVGVFSWKDYAVFAFLVVLAEAIPIELAKGGTVSVGFSIWYSSIVLFGPHVGTVVTALGGLGFKKILRKEEPHKYFFDVAQLAISAYLAGWAFLLVGGVPAIEGRGLNWSANVLPLTACFLVLFGVNSSLPTLFYSLVRKIPFANVWVMNVKPFIFNTATLWILGIILTELYLTTRTGGLILLVIPLLVARQTFQIYANLRRVYLGTIRALVTAIEAKDPYTRGHSERVADYAVQIGREMRLPEHIVEKLEYAAVLHDIGKVGISKRILNKLERLTPLEFREIRKHPQLGVAILDEIAFLKDAVPFVLHHHERVNGTGYVGGLRGKNIPLEARILAVADSFDAMTSERPYRSALGIDVAVSELVANSGVQFDRHVVKAFLKVANLAIPSGQQDWAEQPVSAE
jgi:HD-GYP domain-containing protein (c-di-GMP phosphodiesterase class II)